MVVDVFFRLEVRFLDRPSRKSDSELAEKLAWLIFPGLGTVAEPHYRETDLTGLGRAGPIFFFLIAVQTNLSKINAF